MGAVVQSLLAFLIVVTAMVYLTVSIRRWVRRISGQETGACGGCSGCGPDAPPPVKPDAPRLVGLEPPRRRRST